MKWKIKTVLIACSLSLQFSIPALSQDLFDQNNSRKFAQYLFELNQFELAIPELERIVFWSPTDTIVQTQLFKSYRMANMHSEGFKSTSRIYPYMNQYPNTVGKEVIKLFQSNGYYDSASVIIQHRTQLTTSERFYLLGINDALTSNWHSADAHFNKAEGYDPYSISPLCKQALHLKYKNAVLASVLSGIVPGAGKFYTKNGKDAIFALIFVGGTAFQAYRGFSRSGINSVQGWIAGGLSLGFYTGNIVGSYQSAKKYNKNLDQPIIEKIDKAYYR